MTENEITLLMLQLADMGVTAIKLYYDGYGESIAINEIVYSTEKYETAEDAMDNMDMWTGTAKNLAELNSDFYTLISEFVDSKFLDDIENWWEDEGGFGYMVIMVPSGKYIIKNNIRIIKTEEYFHDGNIMEKTNDV